MNGGNQSEGVESQPQATLCSNGCGFFANVGTSGMCSKCYREAEQAQQKAEAVAIKATAAVSRPATNVVAAPTSQEVSVKTCSVSPVNPEPSTSASGSPAAPPNPCRCHVTTCRKKIGLTGFKCRCGYSFCGQHRHAEEHNCTFDYKTFERLKIADNNPLVQAAKIQKI